MPVRTRSNAQHAKILPSSAVLNEILDDEAELLVDAAGDGGGMYSRLRWDEELRVDTELWEEMAISISEK